jgi:hypothetical protein
MLINTTILTAVPVNVQVITECQKNCYYYIFKDTIILKLVSSTCFERAGRMYWQEK